MVADAATVPFLDVGATYRELRVELDEAVERVLSSGWYVLGPEVTAFEEELAASVDAAHAVGTGNGLDALTLALRAVGVGPGDEVIVPSNTYIATWLAVSAVGAVPVAVEPDPVSSTIDADTVEVAIGPSTRAVLPVHLYGRAAPLGPLRTLADRHGLAMVEDAAQAHGVRYKGRPVGAHGHAVCWSFYPAKNLGAFGDGGAVTTDDPDLAQRVRRLANYGSEEKYHHLERGVNSRLDELQAAVLRVKLAHLDEWNERRRAVAMAYDDGLRGVPGLSLPAPPHDPGAAVWHLYVVRHPDRDQLARRLAAEGVATQIHYPIPPHRQPAYATGRSAAASLPVADALAATVLSLPIGPHLGADQVDRVIGATRRALSP